MKDLIFEVSQYLERNETLVVATVLKKIGPGPVRPGGKLVIRENLMLYGSFGGGLVDVKIKQIAANVFKTRLDCIKIVSFADGCDTCGGKIEVYFEYCDIIDPETGLYFQKIKELAKAKKDFLAITELKENSQFIKQKWICTDTEFYGLENEVFHEKFRPLRRDFNDLKFQNAFFYEDHFFVEPFFLNEKVVIIGAGYIGEILADLCKLLDFYVIVVDNQKEFASRERFKRADEVIVLPSYDQVNDYVPIDDQSYVLVTTRGNFYDQEVLNQILYTEAKYIGMVGSKMKRNRIFQKMIEAGFTYEDLLRVHCPVGLPIEGETPEEIAVSISAELIQLRRREENVIAD